MCARRPFSVAESPMNCDIDPSDGIDLHRKNLICGCHTTRGVKQPYTPTEALRRKEACLSHQRAGQLMGSNWRYDVSTQCVIPTCLCFTEQEKTCDSVNGHLYIRIAVSFYPHDRTRNPKEGSLSLQRYVVFYSERRWRAVGVHVVMNSPPYHRI